MQPETTRYSVAVRRARKAALYASAAIIGLGAAGFLARKPIAAALIEHYLAGQGISSSVDVQRLGFGGIEARAALGKDFSARDIEILFDSHGWFVTKSVRLDRPFLRLGYDGKNLSFGSLQRLVDSFLPKSSGAGGKEAAQNPAQTPAPQIRIDGGAVEIATPAGTVEAYGQGSSAGGLSLNAGVRPVHLHSKDFDADIRGGTLRLQNSNGAIDLHIALAASARGNSFDIADGDFSLDAKAAKITTAPDGALQVQGIFVANIAASKLRSSGLETDNLHSQMNFAGRVASDRSFDLHAGVTAGGDMTKDSARKLAGYIPGQDRHSTAALITAMRAMHLQADDIHVSGTGTKISATLDKPVIVNGGGNAALRIANASYESENGNMHGNAAIHFGGRRLPRIDLDIPAYTQTKDGALDAQIALAARFSAMGLRNANIEANGHMTRHGDAIAYRPQTCVKFALGALQSGKQATLRHAKGQLCADGEQDFFALDSHGWRLQAQWQNASAEIAGADSAIARGAGRIALAADNAGLKTGLVDIATVRIHDTLHAIRYRAIAATGSIALADNVWRGDIALSGAHNRNLGRVAIEHFMLTGTGRATIDAHSIAFAENGLQPSDLSPLLSPVTRAHGSASFTGQIAWNACGLKSHGELDIDHMDFTSPLGPASETNSHIELTSLIPLQTAPGQTITLAHIGWFTPLTEMSARFELGGNILRIGGAQTRFAGGRITLDPLIVNLAAGQTVSGTVRAQNVDLGIVIASSNLASTMKVDQLVAGSIPFAYGPNGLRLTAGSVFSLGPGRLSIDRSLWAGAVASGGGSNAIRDFAFQALEHLAVEEMSGTVNSLPNGRLGVIFHIKGTNDPLQPQETTISLFSLLEGTALDKPIPLPKNTPVDLTLDTSLNFDELLAAYRGAWSADMAAQEPPPQPDGTTQ